MQYDPEVISFLKLRNAPLTHANYNSVLAQMQSNPSMRGAAVAEPDRSDKSYDGGLDELNLGDDVRVSHNEPAVKHGSDDAKSAHAPNGATRNAGPAANIADDADAEDHDRTVAPAASPMVAGGGLDEFLGPMLAAAGGGAGAAGLYAALNRGGAGGAPGGATDGGRSLVALGGGAPSTLDGAPARDPADLLAGHAPPAALPAPQQLQLQGPSPQQQLPAPQAATPQMLSGTALQPQIEAQGSGSTFTTPGAAPSTPVQPMPDNAGSGTLEALMSKLRGMPIAMRMQLVQALQGLGHVR